MAPKSASVSVFDIVEEALALLRSGLTTLLPAYYIGTLPFILGLIWYWADMSQSGSAEATQVEMALGLALLFLWMKLWQTIYARRIWLELRGQARESRDRRRWGRILFRQAALQPWGLILIPIAVVITIPFGEVYAFFQNITVLDDGDSWRIGSLCRQSWRMVRPWRWQNYLLIWLLSPCLMMLGAGLLIAGIPLIKLLAADGGRGLFLLYAIIFLLLLLPLSPFGLMMAVNIGSAIILCPVILKTLLGIQSIWADNPRYLLTSTFLALVCGLTYLLLDPLIKACYVLRCFLVESQTTGEDLRLSFRQLSRRPAGRVSLALLLGLLTLGAISALAAPAEVNATPNEIDQARAHAASASIATDQEGRSPSVVKSDRSGQPISPPELDQAIRNELARRIYTWRLPAEKTVALADSRGWLLRFLMNAFDMLSTWAEKIQSWLGRCWDWLKGLFPRLSYESQRNSTPLPQRGLTMTLLLYLLLAVILSGLGVYAWRAWRQRRQAAPQVAHPLIPMTPDLTDEATTASQLPEERWLELAEELWQRGEGRLALRSLFLAILAGLASRQLIRIARFKSNGDYLGEIARRGHVYPDLPGIFSECVALFEQIWYGRQEVSMDFWQRMIAHRERLSAHE